MSHRNEDSRAGQTEAMLRALRLGAERALAGGKAVPFMGRSIDQASLLAIIDGWLAPYVRVRRDRTALEKDLGERRANGPSVLDFVRIFKGGVAATFGETSDEFALFGFKPRKKPVELTPEQKKHRVEQLRATRRARNTLGKRQRRAVKGIVPPPPVPPAPPPPAPDEPFQPS